MKHIYLNLKRFDVPPEFGGVNRISSIDKWAGFVVKSIQDALKKYVSDDVEFILNLPEAHIIGAVNALSDNSPLQIGCQSVYQTDIGDNDNFGALTSLRPASAMAALGCKNTVVGHFEERTAIAGILAEANIVNSDAVNRILNKEIKAAHRRNLSVLFCIGEKSSEQKNWQKVLVSQIEAGLREVDTSKVVIGYEPVWSIGPGKTPADKEYITKVVNFIKSEFGGIDVVYGGGLRKENATMLSTIEQLDGGVIALTRFQGDIGFYPDDYLEFLKLYLGK